MGKQPHSGARDGDLARVVVIGTSCSGKTTFASRLAGTLDVPHVELDALYWMPGWVERPDDAFRALVADAVATPAWVVDGNYAKVRDLVWPRATAVIWLHFGFVRVLWRGARRTVARCFTGEPLYAGNVESWRNAFLSRHSILLWIIRTHRSNARRYRAAFEAPPYDHVAMIELDRPARAESFLRSLAG